MSTREREEWDDYVFRLSDSTDPRGTIAEWVARREDGPNPIEEAQVRADAQARIDYRGGPPRHSSTTVRDGHREAAFENREHPNEGDIEAAQARADEKARRDYEGGPPRGSAVRR